MPEPASRLNKTMHEVILFLDAHPDDVRLEVVAGYIGTLVGNWRSGHVAGEEVVRLFTLQEESELEWHPDSPSAVILAQAPMWFGYEANLSLDVVTPTQKV